MMDDKDISVAFNEVGDCDTKRSPDILGEHTSLLTNSAVMKIRIPTCHKPIQRSLTVDILCLFFGVGSWIGVNAVYVQFPLLVEKSPEGWNLPSYLVVIIQMANIGPISYSILQKCLPGRIRDSLYIYGLLVVGAISAILFAFYFKHTSILFGSEHSTAMFVLVFFLALVGCTSSVLFMPFMGRYREQYLVSYLIGEGLSGFLPSIVALIQGVGGNPTCVPTDNSTVENPIYVPYTPPPRFSTTEFFCFIFSMLILSFLSFFLLNYLPIARRERCIAAVTESAATDLDTLKDRNPTNTQTTNLNRPASSNNSECYADRSVGLSNNMYYMLLILIGVICLFGNGVFPSIQSYSCLPYGNVAYHLTVTLSSIANPLACFVAVWLPHTSIRSIISLSGAAALVSGYVISCSLLSPTPPLKDQLIGEVLVVMSWIILVGLISYVKLCITAVFRLEAGRSLFHCGAVSQFGSAVGAIITFCLLNFTNIFQQYYHCQ